MWPIQFIYFRKQEGFPSVTGVCLGILLGCIFSLPAWAEEPLSDSPDNAGVFSMQVENDGLNEAVDGYYTNGFRFSYLPGKEAPLWSRNLAAHLPVFNQGDRLRVSYALGQNIFTPEDISRKEVIPDDRPYAGWLYVGLGLITDQRSGEGRFRNRRDSLELNLGMVGSVSLAEQLQTSAHKLRGATRPEG